MLLLSIHHAGTRTRTWHTSVVSWSRCKKWVIFWELNFSEADSGRTKKIADEFDPSGILWLSWNRSQLRRSLKLKASCSQNQVDRLPWFFLLVDERVSPAKNRFSLLDPSILTFAFSRVRRYDRFIRFNIERYFITRNRAKLTVLLEMRSAKFELRKFVQCRVSGYEFCTTML